MSGGRETEHVPLYRLQDRRLVGCEWYVGGIGLRHNSETGHSEWLADDGDVGRYQVVTVDDFGMVEVQREPMTVAEFGHPDTRLHPVTTGEELVRWLLRGQQHGHYGLCPGCDTDVLRQGITGLVYVPTVCKCGQVEYDHLTDVLWHRACIQPEPCDEFRPHAIKGTRSTPRHLSARCGVCGRVEAAHHERFTTIAVTPPVQQSARPAGLQVQVGRANSDATTYAFTLGANSKRITVPAWCAAALLDEMTKDADS